MKYYIRTNINKFKYELSSEGYDTKEECENKIKAMHQKKRLSSEIVAIPSNIGVGTILYRGGEYYLTIVGESDTLWFAKKNTDSEIEIANPIFKETLIKWFIEGKLDAELTEKEGD